ncbi:MULTISPECIES: hypothetical protein [Gordonibacter]|uniref:Uncharacterized protein n=1 Tax=Gordonibacter faecis TaxID=3047475 RepID=A0ABT7DJX8_9ACTN|nr:MULTISPECIES: hypothetical protein [unclassified Gordonibacter]MDJ1649823.1 hypothetical protein [Gordonibacter sp. KGMB12511]HIW75488.1 hypothetical protein [Candidatus Gordonibacter avicola]
MKQVQQQANTTVETTAATVTTATSETSEAIKKLSSTKQSHSKFGVPFSKAFKT